MFRKLIIPAVIIGILASCSKSKDSGSGYAQMSYKMQLANTNTNMMRTAASASLVWTSGFANPEMIKFDARDSGTQIEYKSTNEKRIDLFASTAVNFGGFTLPPGNYTEIELVIDMNRNDPDPALELQGRFTNGAVTIPVLFRVNEPLELKTETHNVTIVSGSVFTIVTTIDMDTATAGITTSMLSGAVVTSGTIIISSESNMELYEILVNNLRAHRHHCEFDRD